jgi:hypothetical protein
VNQADTDTTGVKPSQISITDVAELICIALSDERLSNTTVLCTTKKNTPQLGFTKEFLESEENKWPALIDQAKVCSLNLSWYR